MIAELGHFALALALCCALAQALLPLWGGRGGPDAARSPAQRALLQAAPGMARAQFALLALAYAALTGSFIEHDFSVALVARHSNSLLPLAYRVAAVWGNHEGSILLWALILAGWGVAMSLCVPAATAPGREASRWHAQTVLAVLGAVGVGLLLFTLLASNPFARLLPAPLDGRDLNPMLQDPGMVLHPPLLYMGYVGTAVAFAHAIAGLLAGRLDADWARATRPWALVAWCFLTVGIALGSFWAYYELGWGGWWFWDPVENASFMPWLVTTALVHALAVTGRRGALAPWTALLALVAFGLSLLGTFVVRSGVLTSVHAFATDPARGLFILALLAAVMGVALALFALRLPAVMDSTAASASPASGVSPLSRDSLLLAGSLVLAVMAAAVLLGTLYPLAVEALGVGKISVGAPYFEAVFVPLAVPLLLLAGGAPWASRAQAGRRLAALALLSVAAGVAAVALLPAASPLTGLGLALALWVAGSMLVLAVPSAARAANASSRRGHWRALSGRQGGMLLAHLGLAVFVTGVSVVGSFQSASDLRMRVGEGADVAGLRFTLESIGPEKGPNYLSVTARLRVTQGGETVAVLAPERRLYTASRMPMTEVAIDRSFSRDLYVALGDAVGTDAYSVRIQHKPLVNWIWGGCLLMALGGLLAAADRRAARARDVAASPAATRDASGVARPASPTPREAWR